MAYKDPARVLAGRVGAYTLHARYDPVVTTAPGRSAFLRRFLHEVDPDGELPSEERERRARSALKAHMSRLALRSAQKRARRRAR
jgi:hypothetical protein